MNINILDGQKIVIKHFGGLSSSIEIEIDGSEDINSVNNNKANWDKLAALNASDRNGVEVFVEEQFGFGEGEHGDIREVPLTESLPYVSRYVSDRAARKLYDDRRPGIVTATKAAGFQP